jgi:hypothetical protein
MTSIHVKVELKAANVRDQKKDLQPSVHFCLQMGVSIDPTNSISDRGFYIFYIPVNLLKF